MRPETPRKPFAHRADGKPVHAGWQTHLTPADPSAARNHPQLSEWKFQLIEFLMKKRRQRLVRVRYFNG
jgi:hypothetical protein